MRRARFVALGVIAAGAAAAQDTAPPRILTGHEVVELPNGTVVADLGQLFGNVEWLRASQYRSGPMLIDAAAGRRLDRRGDDAVWSDLAGKELWRADVGRPTRTYACGADLVLADRVVLAVERHGLVGLDRATGEVAWELADVPNECFVAEDGLVVAADQGGRFRRPREVMAFSARNGALAFRIAVEAPVRALALGGHGVAIAMPKLVAVHDRAGPRLFALDVDAVQVAATADGWFVLARDRLLAVDRAGGHRWEHAWQGKRTDEATLAAMPDGDALLARCEHGGTGVTVQRLAAADGAPCWQAAPVLSVFATGSIELRVAGDHIVLALHGMFDGGAALLAAADGAELARQVWRP